MLLRRPVRTNASFSKGMVSVMASNSLSRPLISARNTKVIAGIQKRLEGVPSIVLDGVSYTPTSLVALFESQLTSQATVSTTKGAWTAAVSADSALAKKVNSAYTALQHIVRTMFANAADVLADFGMTPTKSTKPTLLTKVVASEKRTVTRGARHTMGKKERLAISGDATASDIASALTDKIVPAAPAAPSAQSSASHPAEPAATPVALSSPVNGGGRSA
jgi:hypothetical protein